MGEDSCRNVTVDKKNISDCHITNGTYNGHHNNNNMNGFGVSSCSEADSESTTYIGDIEESMDDQDYQYGPGIVSKLRTKFLSISLKQSRGGMNTMRRSCSLEDILDQKTPVSPTNIFVSANKFGANGESKTSSNSFSNLKRAKSMDTLLLSVAEEQRSNNFTNEICPNLEKAPKVIRKKDGPLTRSNISICDEELPKPDTVKTYKRMFEPADSTKKANATSNVRRRPPVLRATAKSGSTFTTKSTGLPPKMNGTLPNPLPAIRSSPTTFKSKFSAKDNNIVKESSPKVISNLSQNEFKKIEENKTTKLNNSINTTVTKKEPSLPMNGFVKAEPVKFKQKEDPIKRNFRTKNFEGQRLSKPAVPANKPLLISPKPNLSAAQILEKKNIQNKTSPLPKSTSPLPKSTSPKPEAFEKPILKPILSKQVEKSTVSTNNKIEISQDIESIPSVPVPAKPVIENGIQKTNIQKDLPVKIEATQHLVNGYSKSESVEQTPIPHHLPTPLVSKKVPILERNNPPSPPSDPVKDNVRKNNPAKSMGMSNGQNSMVFDFRGKDVVTHLAIIPAPFGCRKAAPAAKKRSILLDGKEPYALNGLANGDTCVDEDDDDYVDYSTPLPCGLIFEGENVKVGKGAILLTRNKDLKIQFDEDVGNNTFVYPSESSYLSDDSSSITSSDLSLEDSNTKLTNGVVPAAKLRSNMAIGSNNGVGGLMSYTPSVLRTVDNFQPGIFRVPEKDDSKLSKKETSEGEEENRERKEKEQNGVVGNSDNDSEMLKPADPEFISSWSLSANTSDLLF